MSIIKGQKNSEIRMLKVKAIKLRNEQIERSSEA